MARSWARLVLAAALGLVLLLSISPGRGDLTALCSGCREEVLQPQVGRETQVAILHRSCFCSCFCSRPGEGPQPDPVQSGGVSRRS